jgi:haloalkane dehalogenase
MTIEMTDRHHHEAGSQTQGPGGGLIIPDEVLRTPDQRFAGLPDYPFQPNYHMIAPTLRLHYLDEGPREGPTVLMLHGEPTWSYLWRHIIPPVAAAGCRVLAPDLIGFGRSDKPGRTADHSYAGQVAWILHWIEALDLKGITLVCQDWGSLVGLRLAAEHPHRFDRILLGNGGLPTGDDKMPMAFSIWQAFTVASPWFPIGRIVKTLTQRKLSATEVAAYDAPFPSDAYKAGARIYPSLVPTRPDDPAAQANRRAWETFEHWDKPFITCFSDGDPITRGRDREFLERVPGTVGQPHATLRGSHFLQEDDPETFARMIIQACRQPRV